MRLIVANHKDTIFRCVPAFWYSKVSPMQHIVLVLEQGICPEKDTVPSKFVIIFFIDN